METRAPTHPSADKLRGFGIGQLDDADAVAVMSHLDSCPQCQKAVAAVTGDNFLDRLREARSRSGTPLPGKSLSQLARSLYATMPPAALGPTVSDLPSELANHPQYEVVSELGRGGMGVVYLARHRLSGRHEVLKVMNKELMVRSGSKERFLREIQSAAMLDHPNVVKMYTAMELGDLMVLVMEYVKGEDLAKLVKAKGRLPVPNACFYAQQTALGLQHAFDKKMVHRDIKPLNLMLAKEGKKHIIKVLDFGLAKVARETGEQFELTGQGQMLGTPDYVAPEQTLDATNADIRADIYSLGCTLYYLLAGHAPFKGKSLFEVLQAHQSTEAKPLNLERPEVPEEVAAIVAKMMAKDPGKRFQEPKEVAQALTPFFRADAKSPSSKLSQDSLQGEVVSTTEKVKETKSEKLTVPAPALQTLTEGSVPSSKTANSKSLRPKSTQSALVTRKKLLIGGGVLVVVLLVSLIGLWPGMFKVKTKDGTIVLENLPADAEVLVDGETLTIKFSDGNPIEISVPAGKKHQLQVKKEGFKVFGKELEIDAGDRRTISIRLEQEAAAGFVQMFNGKDLAGWKDNSNGRHRWRVENGIIVANGPAPASGLFTEREDFANFHLRIETMLSEGPNSSINFHVGRAFIGGTGLGEADKTGDLYSGQELLMKATHIPLEPGEWFTEEVIVAGNHITILINGKPVVDFTNIKDSAGKGPLSLMCRGNALVRFRKIEIKELNMPKTELPNSAGGQSAIRVLRGHEAMVKHLLFTPDGSRLISASNSNHDEVKGGKNVNEPGNDNTVRVWNVESGEQIRKFLVNEGFGYGPHGIGLSRDGRFLAACTSWDWGRSYTQPRVFVWDITSGKRLHHFLLPGDRALRAVGFSPDGKMLYAVRSGKDVHSWSMPDGKEAGTIEYGNKNVGEMPFATTFTSGCMYVLAGVWDGPVRLFDRETGMAVKSFRGHTKVPNGVVMSPDGARILSCAGDFSVRMWETESGRQVLCLDNLDSNILCVAFSPEGKSFLTGGEDGAVRLRDTATGKELARFLGHTAKVNCVAYSPDGRLATSGGDDKTIRLWPLNTPWSPETKPNPAEGNATANGPVPTTLTEEVKARGGMPAKEQGFVPLFNGKDLTGWKTHPKQPGNWRVEKGILIGSGPLVTSHLYTERDDYKDFHLRLEARINEGGNSGVYFRAPFGPTRPANDPRWLNGYNAKIDGKRLGGFLLDHPTLQVPLVRSHEPSIPTSQWLTLEVIVKGYHIVVKINGETTADYLEENRCFASGHIALQQHTPTTEVEFRKIEIKELPPQKSTGVPATLERRAVKNAVGSWRHDGDELVQETKLTDVRLWFGDPKWTDYDLTFDEQHGVDAGAIGALVRSPNINNGLMFTTDWGWTTYGVHLLKNNAFKDLGGGRWKLEKADWHEFTFKVRGERLQCWHDRAKVMDRVVPELPREGAICLRTWGLQVRFRNIKVTDPDGKVLWKGMPEVGTSK
jgi:serine/threonine protein kinase/WD40 repeat protein